MRNAEPIDEFERALARSALGSAAEAEDEEDVPEEGILLEQAFIKDPAKTVQDLVAEVAARVRENIRVKRFSRFALGE